MNDLSMLQSSLQSIRSRSMGLKLIVVCALALLMIIPALLVWALVNDRTSRESDVVREISNEMGGQQTFLGPVLAIPCSTPSSSPSSPAKEGLYLVFPVRASALAKTATEERRRSLFKVPVFRADLTMDAAFDLTGVPTAAPEGAVLDWSRAEMLVGVSDARGARADAVLTLPGRTATLTPSGLTLNQLLGGESNPLRLTLFSADVAGIAKPGAQFSVSSTMRFSGAQRLAVLAYGKTTHLTVQGDWPNPSFDGGFLPTSHSITPNGFTADWSVPFIARGVRAEGPSDSITGLEATALGTSFVEVADPYQSVTRSLKYVPLFLGLVFLTYFIFEATNGRRVHPAQYILVGIAQIIFYLLLLSFAERIGFDLGFLLAGAATVALLSANAGWIFASRLQGLRALGVFSALYLLIYLLLRLEDNALLVGALASFAAVAAAMYFTRGMDWYSSLPSAGASGTTPGQAATGAADVR